MASRIRRFSYATMENITPTPTQTPTEIVVHATTKRSILDNLNLTLDDDKYIVAVVGVCVIVALLIDAAAHLK